MHHIELLAKEIAKYGVKYIFGIPGSGPSLVLIDALERLGVDFYLTHSEGSAALMAGTIGSLSGKSQVAISIKGPGLANMLQGLAACTLESFPLVSISEAYMPNTPSQNAHKRLDHKKLLSGLTKGETFLSEHGKEFIHLAGWAESEVPGPVHINIGAEPEKSDAYRPMLDVVVDESNLSAQAKLLINSSDRPVVIAGTLAARKGWSSFLNDLKIPVFSTAAAKGVVDETLEHSAGVFTGSGGECAPERHVIQDADLIIGLGLRHNEVLSVFRFHCPSIQIDPCGDKKSYGFGCTEYQKGTLSQVREIFSVLAKRAWGIEKLSTCKENLTRKMLQNSFLPAIVFEIIERHFQQRARLVLDTGNFCVIGEHMWRVPKPEWYLASGQGRYMGIGLLQGIAASLYDQEVPTLVFTGDGGIGMFIGEIKLAVQYRLPILVVLLTDSFLGTVRLTSLKNNLTQLPATVYQPSWIKAMEGLGVPAERVQNAQELERALQYWEIDGPLFLEAVFDSDAYVRMTDGIRQ